MTAKLYARIPPHRFDVASVIDTAKGMTEVERVGHGWHTLLERGLLHGRIRYEGAFAVLDLDHGPPRRGCSATPPSPAPTTQPTSACTPGALTELGIPATALAGPKAWEQWLYG
ncbi:hypothetical protein [Streptomyces sp. NPDC046984]|uniref:hypothetical protein n=1 Tax=unclassified Streptomyces TaxID=2593676 RepID=UPI0033EBE538